MDKRYVLFYVLLINTIAFAADPEPFLKSSPMPFYPRLALQARIQGEVLLQVKINQAGETSVQALSGHALLREATVEYVKEWKFGWPKPCACTVTRKVKFVYKVVPESPDSPSLTVRWFGMNRVEVDAESLPVETRVAY